MKNKIIKIRRKNNMITSLAIMVMLMFTMIGVTGCELFEDASSDTSTQVIESNKNGTSTTENVKATSTGNKDTNATNTESTNSSSTNVSVSGKLKVHFINVGQADAILIEQGKNSMLIDAGNNGDSETVKNYISNQGITKLDYVVGTHPHEDHIGGLDYIINSFQIGNIYMPKVTSTTKTFTDVVSAIQNKGMQSIAPKVGDSFKLGEAEIKILAPSLASYEDLNNYSIVFKITFGNNSFLFDGDAQEISEMEMINRGFDVKADVLKVGHHGSNSSTCDSFLKAVSPKYAVISVGKDNSYGHPHELTMNRLKSNNIPVYRTDECGTIVCTSDGNSISFSTNPGGYSFRGNGATSTGIDNSNPNSSTTINSTDGSANKVASDSQDNSIVYIVGSGKKYHKEGCSYLHGDGKAMTLKDAVDKGYTPCSKCNP